MSREVESAMRKRVVALLAMVAVMVMLAVGPASAQGGCKDFGVEGVSDQARNQEGGMGGYASIFGPQGAMDDQIHQSQEDFCSR
jgi:hypothetical protein